MSAPAVDPTEARARLTALLTSDPGRLRRRGISLGVPLGDADDVAQDIASRAWQSVPGVRSAVPGSPCAWLDSVARSVVVDSARRCHRTPLHDDIDTVAVEGPQRVEDEVAAKERLREVRAAIARMPRSLRDPLVLRVEDELSTAEIAERLGITVFAVRQRLTRARHFLSA